MAEAEIQSDSRAASGFQNFMISLLTVVVMERLAKTLQCGRVAGTYMASRRREIS